MIDFQGLFRSGICTYFAGANTFGFADARELAPRFYGKGVTVPPEIVHAVDRNIYLINQVLGTDEEYLAPRFRDQPELAAKAAEICREQGLQPPLLAVAPASRWPSKTWPAEFFAAVISAVQRATPESTACLAGTADERPVGEAVIAAAPGARIANLMGKTSLPLMVELLKRAAVLLTNDSGPMHIAAALGLPTVALFGPTSPEKTGPYGPRHQILRTAVKCAPCLKRECPLPRQLCLDDVIQPAAAAAAIQSLLQ